MWWDLDWELVCIIHKLRWVEHEFLELFFGREDKFGIFVLDTKQLVSFFKFLVLFFQCYRTVGKQLLFLGQYFC